jgi:hypothetical protein
MKAGPDAITPKLASISHKSWIAMFATAALLIALLIILAAFPVGILRSAAERSLSKEFGAPVELGALERDSLFSFTPLITARDLCIGQPAWAGTGNMATVKRASARVSIFSILTGDAAPRTLDVEGLDLALVRDADGNSNWGGPANRKHEAGKPLRIAELRVRAGRFTLKDAKRRLDIAGTIDADLRKGLRIAASGSFNGTAATLQANGGGPSATAGAWPFTARLSSRILDVNARGTMAAPLDTTAMKMKISARGTSLKQLDHIIEAGLFGTQAIGLDGDVRRKGEDWFIDSLRGKIGRSTIRATAKILKREGRTKIDGTIDAPELDFDDLADDAGLAAARAKEARIGPRILPDTRINLEKMGPTDGTIRVSIARLLIKGGSVFQSLSGTLKLDHQVLRFENAVAGLERGKMTGWVKVDSRNPTPILTTELRIEGASLDAFIGQPDMIRGPLRGIVRITGRGDTVRQAFAAGSGKIAFVSTSGAMNSAAAYVIGQDLGGAIGQKIGGDDEMTPIRCGILTFRVKNGKLTPAPLVIDTAISRARGSGLIDLDSETVALSMTGAASEKPGLKLVDPLKVKGTLSSPEISFAPVDKNGKSGGLLGAVGRSIGTALGLRKDPNAGTPLPRPGSVNCRELAAAALK